MGILSQSISLLLLLFKVVVLVSFLVVLLIWLSGLGLVLVLFLV